MQSQNVARRGAGHRKTAVIAAAAMLAALLAAAAPARAAFPGGNGLIAFRSPFQCDFEQGAIGVIAADGSARRQVTACGDVWYGPDWSPDGAWILFSGPHQIFRTNVAGSSVQEVTAGVSPSFAPDGRHLVYVRASRQIWRAGIDGSHARRLRTGTSYGARPLWSPHGRTIAYHQYRRGIWLISARTGRLVRRLTTLDMLPLDWSPDARWILCARARSRDPDNPNFDLYVVRADGKGASRLTRTRHKDEFDAAWSPDRRRMVVLVKTHPRPGLDQVTMITMTTHATRRRPIWRTPAYDPTDESLQLAIPFEVSWQPLPR